MTRSPFNLTAAYRYAFRGALLAVAALTLLAASAGHRQRHDFAAVAQAAPVKATCTAPTPTTAAGFKALLGTLPASQWEGADDSISVRLADGRVVWVYADTISAVAPTFVHSTAIVQSYGCLHVANSGAQLLPNAADGSFYWPSAAVPFCNTGGCYLLVAAEQVMADNSPAGFHVVGSAAALVKTPTGADPVFYRWVGNWPQADHGIVGAGLYLSGATLHVYTTTDVQQTYVFGRQLSHRSAPLAAVVSGTASWTADTVVIPASPDGTDSGVSAYSDPSGFHVVTKRWNYLGQTVVRYTAPEPDGPFGPAAVVLDSPSSSDHMTYSAQVHPWARMADGGLLITICNNGPGAFTDPTHVYQPTYAEVTR
jgi:hypothetical protein